MGTMQQIGPAGAGPIEQAIVQTRDVLVAAVRNVDRALLVVVHTLFKWQERAQQRKQLAEMGDHLRADMGLTCADVWREAEKPFWTK